MSDDELPTAVAESEVEVMGVKVKVYHLDDGRLVIDEGDMMKLMRLMTGETPDK